MRCQSSTGTIQSIILVFCNIFYTVSITISIHSIFLFLILFYFFCLLYISLYIPFFLFLILFYFFLFILLNLLAMVVMIFQIPDSIWSMGLSDPFLLKFKVQSTQLRESKYGIWICSTKFAFQSYELHTHQLSPDFKEPKLSHMFHW